MPQMDEIGLTDDVKSVVNKVFWTLFERNKGVTVVTIKRKILIFPISITVTLEQLRPLFESIFGPEAVDDTIALGV